MFLNGKKEKINITLFAVMLLIIVMGCPVYAIDNTSPAAKAYYGYVIEEIESTIYIPEDWTYMIEYNDEGSYVFISPDYGSELSVYYIDLQGQDPGVDSVQFLQYINSDASRNGSSIVYLSSIDTMMFGIYEGAYCVTQVTSRNGSVRTVLQAVYITGTHLVGISFFDDPDAFLRNLDTYETILGSIAVGPVNGRAIMTNMNSFVAKEFENWVSSGMFRSTQSGRTQDIEIVGSKMRIQYMIPQGQMSLRIYDSATDTLVESYFLNGSGVVVTNCGSGVYFLEISHGSTDPWTLSIEELLN